MKSDAVRVGKHVFRATVASSFNLSKEKNVELESMVVSTAQARGWAHPLVKEVLTALKNTSDTELPKALSDIIWDGAIWSGFLPLPFTCDSEEGKRLLTAWTQVKKDFPNSALINEFVWKFWNPELHDADARSTADVTDIKLINALEATQAASV